MTPRLHTRKPAGLPPTLRALTAPCYLHRAARWKVATLLGVALGVVGAALGGLGLRLATRGLDAAEGVFMAFLGLFALLLLRPATWRVRCTLAADRQGLFVLGDRDAVFVPWHEIGPLTVERVVVGEGVGRCVIVAIDRQSAFWDAARRSPFSAWLLGDEKPPGYLRLPIGTQGIDPLLTQASLEALRPPPAGAAQVPQKVW